MGRQYGEGVRSPRDTTHVRWEQRRTCLWLCSSTVGGFSIQERGTTD